MSKKKPVWFVPLLMASFLFSGCQTLHHIQSAFVSPEPLYTPPATSSSTNPQAPGSLHFILEDTGWGDYHGWQIQILSAQLNQGFQPQLSKLMEAGEHLKVQLWPDQYHIRVTLNNSLVYDGQVRIQGGQSTVVFVRISMLRNKVDILEQDQASEELHTSPPTRTISITQTFSPLPVMLIPHITGRYEGPRHNNAPTGQGRLLLYKENKKIASMDEAIVLENGQLSGEPIFEDGRIIENYNIAHGEVTPDSITRYKDGRQFVGRYEALSPKEGTMHYPSGERWTGSFNNDAPQGTGTLGLPDGSQIVQAPSMDTSTFDGSYECVSPQGKNTACYYFEGEPQASAAEYQKQVGWRSTSLADAVKQAEELAAVTASANQTQAATTPTSSVPVAPPTASAPLPLDGCTNLRGEFATSTQLSKIRFDGQGRGHFWQASYGGSSKYFFEANFRYQGTRDSMQFDYDEAIYKDAGGRVLQRQSLPGGSSACSYNGRILNIGGTEYVAQ